MRLPLLTTHWELKAQVKWVPLRQPQSLRTRSWMLWPPWAFVTLICHSRPKKSGVRCNLPNKVKEADHVVFRCRLLSCDFRGRCGEGASEKQGCSLAGWWSQPNPFDEITRGQPDHARRYWTYQESLWD